MLDVPGGGPFIQKSVLKNAINLITWPSIRPSDVIHRRVESADLRTVVGYRLANPRAVSALNNANLANHVLSTPRDRFSGIGLRHFAWKQFRCLCKRYEGVGHPHRPWLGRGKCNNAS